MKKAYHLQSCSTCKRILKELDWKNEQQEIRTQKITPDQLDGMARLAGSYESLFNRRAMKFKSMGLKDHNLTEQDYRELILMEDTFLKRPIIILNDKIFIGNSKKVIEAAKLALNE